MYKFEEGNIPERDKGRGIYFQWEAVINFRLDYGIVHHSGCGETETGERFCLSCAVSPWWHRPQWFQWLKLVCVCHAPAQVPAAKTLDPS